MSPSQPSESLEEKLVTYTVEVNGQIIVIEHVPARVCIETGEQFFSPQTVDRIHSIVRGEVKPARKMPVPVFEFAA